MGTVILDSCVMLGMMDPADALHEASARAVRDRRRDEFVVPAIVFAEVLVAATRDGAKVVRAYEEMIDDIAKEVRPIDRETAKAAAAIRAKHKSIRLPDALVLATGELLDREILTADKRWSRVDRRVTVLNSTLNLLARQPDLGAQAVRDDAVQPDRAAVSGAGSVAMGQLMLICFYAHHG